MPVTLTSVFRLYVPRIVLGVVDVVEADLGAEDAEAGARAADREAVAAAEGEARVGHVEGRRCAPTQIGKDPSVRRIPVAGVDARLAPFRCRRGSLPRPKATRKEWI